MSIEERVVGDCAPGAKATSKLDRQGSFTNTMKKSMKVTRGMNTS